MRMGPARKLKQTVFEMFKEGDLLMDVPKTASWRELTTYVMNKDYWRVRVRAMTQPRVTVDICSHFEEEQTLSFTVSN